jgi:hypothetical protein
LKRNSLAANRLIGKFRIEAAQLRVAYIDFELSGRQLRQRYTNDSTDEDFDVGFYRLGFNPTIEMPTSYNSFDDYIDAAIEYPIRHLGARCAHH